MFGPDESAVTAFSNQMRVSSVAFAFEIGLFAELMSWRHSRL